MKFWRPGTVAPGSSEEVPLEGHEDNTALLAAAFRSSQLSMSMEQFRHTLPVSRHRRELLYLLEHHQVVILHGQTGSGKTTQVPQYVHEAGWTGVRMVACTQPRRVAAISVATRVAEECGSELGELVGYAVRFEEKCGPTTRIKYMTDGMLFREALFDPLLSRYSVIMIDEAHERSLYTDLLLGLTRKILRRRTDLKVIISSATMDAEAFLKYFSGPQALSPVILSVQGRMYPVDIFYLQSGCVEVAEEAAATVCKIHRQEGPGDILVFLAGKDEIDRCIALLNEDGKSLVSKDRQTLCALPLHASLPLSVQMKVFEAAPKGTRKVIVATNIAEASITIDGIVYVVDGGLVKQRVFNSTAGIDVLLTTPVSQASAQQRAGRAGRLRPGKAYRLYTEEHFRSLRPNSVPEMQKCNLASVVLQLKALGIDNILGFDWMAPPPPDSLASALEFLWALGAIDGDGRLTATVGVIMAELPVDPMIARMLIASSEFNCGAEAATVAAMLSAQPIFVNVPGSSQRALEEAKRKLGVAEGDLISHVNIFNMYQQQEAPAKWCARHFLSHRALQKAVRIRKLLARYMARYGLKPTESAANVGNVLHCLVKGLFANAAIAQPDGSYRSIRHGRPLYIHPGSVLFRRVPACVLYYEMMETSKPYMRDVTVIESEWLAELAPNYYEFRRMR